jgi:mono/diheme cytochrome c family protein
VLSKFLGPAAIFLLAASVSARQADQVAGAEKERNAQQQKNDPVQKEKTSTAVADLMGGPHLDPAAVERGRSIFLPTCGFCHGNDAHGKSGPDLVRSAIVLHDKNGDTIGPVIRNGRPDRGMPAFSSLAPDQIADISTFLHSRAADVSNRFAYKIGDLITGDPKKGAEFFNGAGHCDAHQGTGVAGGRSALRRTGEKARRSSRTVTASGVVMIWPEVSRKRRWMVSGVTVA